MKKIMRMSRVQFDPQILEEVVAFWVEIKGKIVPRQGLLPGYIDGYVGFDRQNATMVWVTFWDTMEHGKALGAILELVASNSLFRKKGLKFESITTHEAF